MSDISEARTRKGRLLFPTVQFQIRRLQWQLAQIEGQKMTDERKWTTEFPTKPGYYWIRNFVFNAQDGFIDNPTPGPDIAEIAEITLTGTGGDSKKKLVVLWTGTDCQWNREDVLSAEWQGPIYPFD